MSNHFKEHKERYIPEYNDGRTKQAFKDQCDINKIMAKAMVKGDLSFAQKYDTQVFGEFDGEFTLLEAQGRLQRASEIFGELSSETRKEFQNDPLKFLAFANAPENRDRLVELLPQIAEPGAYFPNPVQRGGQGAAAATAPKEAVPAAQEAPQAPRETPPESGANTST